MNDNNKTPLQREFEQSGTYRVMREVGGKVIQELNNAGITPETVTQGVQRAAEGISRAVEHINREFGGQPQANTAQHPKNTAQQPVNGTARYTNYKTPQSNYTPPVQNRTQPPRVRPVPPQKPRMEMRRKPSNTKYWATGAVCALYALTMPMTAWQHLIPFALVGVGTFVICRALFKGKKYFVPVEPPQAAPVKKPEPEPVKKVNTGDPEVDKIIEEGYAYLKQLKTANDRIEDAVMSERIERMEKSSADIFAYIAEHPEKSAQIRRFMNYYLPTTLKLLTSYDKLSRQSVKGENIQKTMFEIEGMMETIAGAFEKQLDSLFHAEAMDIAADISVMETILEQEGLSGSKNAPKVK